MFFSPGAWPSHQGWCCHSWPCWSAARACWCCSACSEPTCQTSSQQPARLGSSPRSPGSSTFAFSIVYENNSNKSIVKVPKVSRRHTALKIHFSVLVERTFLTLSIGIAPPSRNGSYWLLQVDVERTCTSPQLCYKQVILSNHLAVSYFQRLVKTGKYNNAGTKSIKSNSFFHSQKICLTLKVTFPFSFLTNDGGL